MDHGWMDGRTNWRTRGNPISAYLCRYIATGTLKAPAQVIQKLLRTWWHRCTPIYISNTSAVIMAIWSCFSLLGLMRKTTTLQSPEVNIPFHWVHKVTRVPSQAGIINMMECECHVEAENEQFISHLSCNVLLIYTPADRIDILRRDHIKFVLEF